MQSNHIVKADILKADIRPNIVKFIVYCVILFITVQDITKHFCQNLNHIGHIIISVQDSLNANGFQGIKQKMGINLGTKCQKLCIFLAYTCLIYLLKQCFHLTDHMIIAFYQASEFIISNCFLNQLIVSIFFLSSVQAFVTDYRKNFRNPLD